MQFGLGLFLIIRLQFVFVCCCCWVFFIHFSEPICTMCFVFLTLKMGLCALLNALRRHYYRATVWSNWYGSVQQSLHIHMCTSLNDLSAYLLNILFTTAISSALFLSPSLFFLFRSDVFLIRRGKHLLWLKSVIYLIYFIVSVIWDGFQAQHIAVSSTRQRWIEHSAKRCDTF